jgi:hypothetical protein
MPETPPLNHRPEVKVFLDDMLPAAFPGVRISRAFGYPAYKIDSRIFAFVCGAGIALKVGEATARRLSAPGTPYSQFVLDNGAVWRAWLNIDRADPAAYEEDLQLFADSIARIRGG